MENIALVKIDVVATCLLCMYVCMNMYVHDKIVIQLTLFFLMFFFCSYCSCPSLSAYCHAGSGYVLKWYSIWSTGQW